MYKSFLALLSAVCLVCNAWAQSGITITVAGYDGQHNHLKFGDSLQTVIANNSNQSVSFFVPYSQQGLEHIGYDQDSAIVPLKLAKAGLVGDSAMYQMLLKTASIIKSNLYLNVVNIGAGTDAESIAALASIGGRLNSVYHQQCNFFAEQAAILLNRADSNLFNANNMRHVNLGGKHNILEVIYKGKWTMFDFDASTRFFTVINPQSINGLASVVDVVSDTSLISLSSPYRLNGYIISIESLTNPYSHYFQGTILNYVAVNMLQTKITGEQVLCAGCKMTFSAKVEILGVDTTTPAGAIVYQAGIRLTQQAAQNQTPEILNSLYQLVSHVYGIDISEVRGLFTNTPPKVMIISQGQDWWVSPSSLLWGNYVPTVTLSIPPSTRDLIIGKYLKLPFLVTSVKSSVPIVLDDTIITNYQENIWTTDLSGPELSGNHVHYLQYGNIPAHNDTITIKLAYNPEMINIFKGFKMEQAAGDSLHVSQVFVPSVLYNGTPNVEASTGIKVYPTLVQTGEVINVETPMMDGNIRLYSMDGKLLLDKKLSVGHNVFTAPAIPGMYLLHVNNSVTKLVVFQ